MSPAPERVCHECGNDVVCEGFLLCTECLSQTVQNGSSAVPE